MPTLPGALLPWVELRFLLADGTPNAGGFLYFYVTGTSTPKDTFSDTALATPNPNPIELDADGRPPNPVFLEAGAYKIVVQDADAVQLYSLDGFEDIALTFLSTSANDQTSGTQDVSAGYVVVTTDNFITLDSGETTDPAPIYLPAAADRGTPLIVKNLATVVLAVTPDGTDTIEGLAAAYSVPAAVSPLFPSVRLLSDGVSNWWIDAGLGIT